MASQTIFGTLNTWGDGDNPGAGAQDRDSNGLNGNWWKIMSFIWYLFNAPAVSLRDAIIGGRNLKSDVADATTIELDGASKKLKVKDAGITNTQIASTVADAATIEKDGSTGKLKIKDLGVSGAKIAANAVGAGKLADGAIDTAARIAAGIITGDRLTNGAIDTARLGNAQVTAGKISHTNNRTKDSFSIAFDSVALNAFGKMNGVSTTATMGRVMTRAGTVTKISINFNDAAGTVLAVNHGTTGYTFLAGQRINAKVISRGAYNGIEVRNIDAAVDYVSGFEPVTDVTNKTAAMLVIEVEYDD